METTTGTDSQRTDPPARSNAGDASAEQPSGNLARSEATYKPADVVQAFLHTLLDRQLATHGDESDRLTGVAETDRLAALELAVAALRMLNSPHARPPQIVVLGPTQTGKSTLTNLLIGSAVAGVSPLAGYTVHAQGFWLGRGSGGEEWITDVLPGFRRCTTAALEREKLEELACEHVAIGSDHPLAGAVIWDTPDFDSLAAHRYHRAVLELAALADVHVLVLSKEKYADLTAWRMLDLLRPLGRPLLICLNKLTPDSTEAVLASLREKLREPGRNTPAGRSAAPDPQIAPLAYTPGLTDRPFDQMADAAAGLRNDLCRLTQDVVAVRGAAAPERPAQSATVAAGVARLVDLHWKGWTHSLRQEHAASDEWRGLVRRAGDALVYAYRRDYLENPQRYDAFRRATIELLALLELPGLSGALTKVRQIITWPARTLLQGGRDWLSTRRGNAAGAGLSSQAAVLHEAIDAQLNMLLRDAARRCDPPRAATPLWHALRSRLDEQDANLRRVLREAAGGLEAQLSQDARTAADQLYRTLQERPALLNSLRAARATADVAGVALAIKAGGAPLHDLLFAPALFAFTSMLTEGALGAYMGRIVEDLKARQLGHMRAALVEQVWTPELDRLCDELRGPGVIGIDARRLAEADAALRAWANRAGVDSCNGRTGSPPPPPRADNAGGVL